MSLNLANRKLPRPHWRSAQDRAQVSEDRSRIIQGNQKLQPGYLHWMIKFPSPQDVREIGSIEYAYSLMAREAGVQMPETHPSARRRADILALNALTATAMPAFTCIASAD